MASSKRPLGLAATRAAKRQRKTDADDSSTPLDESSRKIESTGNSLADLRSMLHTALSTNDADWYRAVLHEAQRLIRLVEGEEVDEERKALGVSDEEVRAVANVCTARALCGMSVVLDGEGAEAKEGEPRSAVDWLEAAETALERVAKAYRSGVTYDWTRGVYEALRCRTLAAEADATLSSQAMEEASKYLECVPKADLPVDALQSVLLVLSLAEDMPDCPATPRALTWCKRVCREMKEGDEQRRALADALLLSASIVADKVLDGADDDEDWTLPDTVEVRTATEEAREGALLARFWEGADLSAAASLFESLLNLDGAEMGELTSKVFHSHIDGRPR